MFLFLVFNQSYLQHTERNPASMSKCLIKTFTQELATGSLRSKGIIKQGVGFFWVFVLFCFQLGIDQRRCINVYPRTVKLLAAAATKTKPKALHKTKESLSRATAIALGAAEMQNFFKHWRKESVQRKEQQNSLLTY